MPEREFWVEYVKQGNSEQVCIGASVVASRERRSSAHNGQCHPKKYGKAETHCSSADPPRWQPRRTRLG